jgi:hypothetical protein
MDISGTKFPWTSEFGDGAGTCVEMVLGEEEAKWNAAGWERALLDEKCGCVNKGHRVVAGA